MGRRVRRFASGERHARARASSATRLLSAIPQRAEVKWSALQFIKGIMQN
ncbi:hypothetical protein ACP70R_035637 [Stipagrostis hirtigluma subsp. patula]